ncbi:MAG: twitch domain-containing radical SAM protein [Halobacteriovoraceae bacterium]|nr:twitch domain-containing radical SAM protein [Halobacteriovoraceae bacterium]
MDSKKIKKINSVSPSFCLAKWTQVTLDLVHGTNHSCHHPKRHTMDAEEVKENPSALHNTKFKKEVRAEMLQGDRPSECVYCWNIEDTPGTHHSDRIVKSTDPWSWPHFDKVLEAGSKKDYSPHYVEVMFDNACNFACTYCLADISSSIKKEMQKFGKYPVRRFHHRMEDPQWRRDFKRDQNPFVEAFWKWLPDIWDELQVLRVTGGEPLLSKHTFRLIEYCLENPQPNMELSLNTNLGVDRDRIEKALDLLQKVKDKGCLKEATLYVSVDTFGKQAEYIRQGMNYDHFMHNLQIFLESDVCTRITLMNTFNVLSLVGMDKLIRDVENLKKKYPKLILDISYLKEPEYLRANIAGKEYLKSLEAANEIISKSSSFNEFEKNKIKRILAWMKVEPDLEERESLRADFFAFVNEYDKRYGENFLETFPEFKEFYIECKKAHFLLA